MRGMTRLLCGVGVVVWCLAATAGAAPPKFQRPVLMFERDYLARPDDALPVGATFEALLQTGKKVAGYEVLGFKPGKSPGTLRAVTYKTEKIRKQDLQVDAVIRFWVTGRAYDVLYDPESKAYVLLDVSRRNEIASQRLRARGDELWSESTDAERTAHLERQRAHASQVGDLLSTRKFALHESEFFLIYSDMPPNLLPAYGKSVDAIYQRMCALFAVYPGENIWAGKCLILVFTDRDSYDTYCDTIRRLQMPDRNVVNRIHYEEDGRVVAYYLAGPNPSQLTYSVTRLSVQGFLYRFRSSTVYTGWIGWGLTQMVAASATRSAATLKTEENAALVELRNRGHLGKILTGKSDTWSGNDQIVCSLILQHLNKRDPVMLRAFLTMIKEGHTTDDALKACFDVTPEQLTSEFGTTVGIPNLRP